MIMVYYPVTVRIPHHRCLLAGSFLNESRARQRSTKGGGMEIGTSSNLRGNPAEKCAKNHDFRVFSRIFAYFHVFCTFLRKFCTFLRKFCTFSRNLRNNVQQLRENVQHLRKKACKTCAKCANMCENMRKSRFWTHLSAGFSCKFEDVPLFIPPTFVLL